MTKKGTLQKINLAEKKTAPLDGLVFYLDLSINSVVKDLHQRIVALGGVVDEFLSKSVTYVVTDRSVRGVGRHQLPSPSQSDEVLPSRQRVPRKGSKLSPRPSARSVLQIADELGVSTQPVEKVLQWLAEIEQRVASKNVQNVNKVSSRDLKQPFLKVEDKSGAFQPLVKEPSELPSLELFTTAEEPRGRSASRVRSATRSRSPSRTRSLSNDSGRKSGYCGICDRNYRNRDKHFSSLSHGKRVRHGAFRLVDKMIHKDPIRFEQFLMAEKSNQLERSDAGRTTNNRLPAETHSPSKTPIRTRSSSESPVRTRSSSKPPVKTRSPSESHVKTRSPSKSPSKTRSPSKSPVKSRSPSESPSKTRSPSKSPSKTRSPSKSPARTLSPNKSILKILSTGKTPIRNLFSNESNDNTRSPSKSPARTKSTGNLPTNTVSPKKSPVRNLFPSESHHVTGSSSSTPIKASKIRNKTLSPRKSIDKNRPHKSTHRNLSPNRSLSTTDFPDESTQESSSSTLQTPSKKRCLPPNQCVTPAKSNLAVTPIKVVFSPASGHSVKKVVPSRKRALEVASSTESITNQSAEVSSPAKRHKLDNQSVARLEGLTLKVRRSARVADRETGKDGGSKYIDFPLFESSDEHVRIMMTPLKERRSSSKRHSPVTRLKHTGLQGNLRRSTRGSKRTQGTQIYKCPVMILPSGDGDM